MSTHHKSLNLVQSRVTSDTFTTYAVILRGGKIRRYRQLSAASLERCRYLIRKQVEQDAKRDAKREWARSGFNPSKLIGVEV